MLAAARPTAGSCGSWRTTCSTSRCCKLKAVVESGDIGEVAGYHVKMVGSGNGGWDVPWSSFEYQLEQIKLGRGIMVFDDGWHKLSTALWLFGPVREVRAWIGVTSFGSGIDIDAPAMISWEHENGVRGVWDITLAPDLYLRSDYYTNDERWEVTGTKGYARVNRIMAAGSRSRASRCTATARCAAITRSTTTGRAASATRAATGCATCAPARAR